MPSRCHIRVEKLSKTYGEPWSGSVHRGLGLLSGALRESIAGTAAPGRIHALDDVSFAIAEGERVGVIGENGAGKSTLLHILAGVASASSGVVDVRGRVHAALTLGLGLREELTGRQNLLLEAEIQGKSRAATERIIAEMIDFVELGDFIDRPLRTYSSGMKARLAFANLVFVDPEILLIDEALSVGDVAFSRKANAAVRRLCDRGRIVLVVSHNLDTIVEMCSRCLWLDRGRLLADGDPAEITAVYRRKMRAREEEDIVSRFRDDQTVETAAARVVDIGIYTAPGDGPTTVVEVGQRARIRIDLQLRSPDAEPPDIRVRIERLDGLWVTDNRLSETALRVPRGGDVRVEADVSMSLRPGYYRVWVDVIQDGALVARRCVAFKVHADRLPYGGDPALYVPITMSAHSRG